MRRAFGLSLALVSVLAVPELALAQTAGDIVRQRREVVNVSADANTLVTRLEQEVAEIVATGHLMPLRIQYGENPSYSGSPTHEYAFSEPWIMMYTLARAYPYVSDSLKSQIVAYVQDENQLQAPWSSTSLGPTGFYRQGDLAGIAESRLPTAYKRRGSMLYSLWLYGQTTGDWGAIQSQWSGLQTAYDQIASSYHTYELLSGAIGMSRLAHQFGNDALGAEYEADAISLMNEGLDFEAFRANAHLDYTGQADWYRGTDGIAYPLFHLSPEVARYMRDSSPLNTAVAAYVDEVVWLWPLWWMAQAPVGDAGYYGEGCAAGPETRMMLFSYYAWVKGAPSSELRIYVDAPDALVGDLFYIQNLVTTIESYGQECWVDIYTGSRSCGEIPPHPTFTDVPSDHPYYAEIEALYQAGYTAGCNTDPLMYCPDQTMNRAESAVFVERGIHGTDGLPPQPTTQTFADLPLDSWAAKWAEALWVDGYTAGCGTNPLIYCPWQGHTRAEGCVFYLHMLNGPDYVPQQPAQQTFADVALDAWYAKWVQAGYDAGLITACQTSPDLRFCPDDPLSRGLAAYMMVQAKGLPLQ